LINIGNDLFKASGRISRIRGWKEVLQSSPKVGKNNQQSDDKELPAVSKGEQLKCDHLKLLDKLTKPPKHYTEGTLIKAMETIGSQVTDKVMKKILRETAGLGTQATRANIIQTLFQRKFIRSEKKLLKATKLGFDLVDAVPDSIKDPLLTAQWEQQLDDIAHNKGQNIDGFLNQQISLLKSIIHQLKQPSMLQSNPQRKWSNQYQIGDPCPKCQNSLEVRQAVKGKKIGQDYIGCSHFPECRFYSW